MMHQATTMDALAPPPLSAIASSSAGAYGIENELEEDALAIPVSVRERSPSPSAMLFEPTHRVRHPADRDPIPPPPAVEAGPSELPRSNRMDLGIEHDPWAGSSSPLPTFEESQRERQPEMSERNAPLPRQERSESVSRTYTSVASGPLARLSQQEASRSSSPNAEVHSNGVSPQPNRRGFFSNLLQPLLGAPRSASQPSATSSPSDSPVRDRRRSMPPPAPATSQSAGLGLGLGLLPDRDVPRHPTANVNVTTSNSSPAALASKAATPPASAEQLTSMGLRMATLTPALPHARAGLPHCGVILDDKYLLIGTSLGLDFLPLDGVLGTKLRRPISLIKKTRFRQLAILKERSNVLLAIAGRNDHVRVYALDGVRSIIEKKMREASHSYAPSAPLPTSTSASGLMPSAPLSMSKGKGRADPPPPLDSLRRQGLSTVQAGPLSPPPPYRRPSVARVPPSPTRPASLGRRRSGTVVASVPARVSPTTSLHSRKSRETLGGRRPSAVALGKRRASSTPSVPIPSSATSSIIPLPGDEAAPERHRSVEEDDDWVDTASDAHAPPTTGTESMPTPKMMARSASVRSNAMDEGLKNLLDLGPPPDLLVQPPSARTIVSAPTSPIVVRGPPSPVVTRSSAGGKHGSPHTAQNGFDKSPTLMRKTGSQHSLVNSRSSPSLGNRFLPRSPVLSDTAEESRALKEFFRDMSPDGKPVPMKRSPSMRAVAAAGMPRSASVGRDGDERAHALLDFLNEGPPEPAPVSPTTRSPSIGQAARPLSQIMPRSASIDRDADQATRDLTQFLRDEAPSSRPPVISRPNGVTDLGRSGSRTSTTSWRTEANASPVPPARASMTSLDDVAAGEALPSDVEAEAQPTARQRKRWSMLDAVFRPNSSLGPSSAPPTANPHSRRHSGGDEAGVSDATVLALLDASFATGSGAPTPNGQLQPPSPRSPRSSSETVDTIARDKRSVPPLVHSESEFGRRGGGAPSPSGLTGTVGAGPNDPAVINYANAEAHPASATAPLEYVKLARTKGARMFKAVETRKKTYLAVLCGDGAERIELFTGSRNVSLSLNRTFVLPETPRSIEFQLQGDELVDIYLVYDESIFALEPATVRVREVGIARNERRTARRERDRDRAQRLEAGLPPLPHGSPPGLSTDLPHRRTQSTPSVPPTPGLATSTVSSASVSPLVPTSEPSNNGSSGPSSARPDASPAEAVSATVSADPNAEPPPKPRVPSAQCFTTWQQLPFIPPVPPSVLASAFVIPPTYDSVVSSTPAPKQASTFAVMTDGDVPNPAPVTTPESSPGLIPLLSPISLLANHPSRHSGPPGLFFVSRGRHMTNIVDGDGRSVIRRPIAWDYTSAISPEHEVLSGLDIFQRLELVLVDGARKTVVVAFGPTQVQAIEVGPKPGAEHREGEGEPAESVEVAPPEALKRKMRMTDGTPNLRDVTFLGKAGETCFWSERVGPSISVHCLAAT